MKINSESLKRLNFYSKLMKVLWYLGIAIGIFLVVTIVLYQANILTDNFGLKLDFMGISIKVDNMYLNGTIFLLLQLSLLVFWGLFMYILNKIKYIIESTVDNKTPFLKKNIETLKHISYSFFISAGLLMAVEAIMSLFFISHNLFEEVNKLEGIEMNQVISIPEWPIIVGVLILILAEIFKHGYQLQQDSDSIV